MPEHVYLKNAFLKGVTVFLKNVLKNGKYFKEMFTMFTVHVALVIAGF